MAEENFANQDGPKKEIEESKDSLRKNCYFAALFSGISPGVGQIYVGRGGRGFLFIFLSFTLYYGAIFLLDRFPNISSIVLIVLLACSLSIFSSYDAYKISKNVPTTELGKWYAKWYMGILAILILWAIPDSYNGDLFHQKVGRPFQVFSSSMSPSLLEGDRIMVKIDEKTMSEIKRGDIIAYRHPRDKNKNLVHRVIGMGGDKIEIKDKIVYLNDKLASEAYKLHTEKEILSKDKFPWDNIGPLLISSDSFFVLGDNRDNSLDSRYFGSIKKSEVIGRCCVAAELTGKRPFFRSFSSQFAKNTVQLRIFPRH